jgi:predicted kinase
MSVPSSTLHVLCGKVAAGKSTLAATLAAQDATVLIAEDDWLIALYAEQMTSLSDYVRCATKLRSVMGPHIVSLLKSGTSVVLDFPANTVEARQWIRGVLRDSGAAHQLHLLNTPDDVCLARLRQRNATGDHPFAVTEEQFRQISKHFVTPAPDEGFDIVLHGVPTEL